MQRPRRNGLACLALAAGLVTNAGDAFAASAIYQCGPGRFSEQPCPGGSRYTPSQPTREPTDEEYKAATEVARREKQLARDLQADREKLERQAARRGAASLSAGTKQDTATGDKKPKKKSEKSGSRKTVKPERPGKTDKGNAQRKDFKAVSPAPR